QAEVAARVLVPVGAIEDTGEFAQLVGDPSVDRRRAALQAPRGGRRGGKIVIAQILVCPKPEPAGLLEIYPDRFCLVDRGRVEAALANDDEPAVLVETAVEAGRGAIVTTGADPGCGDEERVLLAVEVDIVDDLLVAGGFSLAPEFAPAATPEMGAPGLPRQPQCLGVHEADHEDGARIGILDDRGYETVAVEAEGSKIVFGVAHGRTGRPGSARYRFASATRNSPKWKIEAARTASARPGASASTR